MTTVYEPEVKVIPMGFYGNSSKVETEKENSDTEIDKSNELLVISHSGKQQVCKVCGKVLSSPSSYYVHLKLHSGSKPFQCTECEASFCRKPYLEVHMRTHTGEKPFECDVCFKRFTQKSSLNTHKRAHTGDRPYSCDICNKRFAVKSYVTAHRWSHVNDKALSCEQCKIKFTSKQQFATHIRTHSRGRDHECLLCGRTFMRDSYLIRHQNKAHKNHRLLSGMHKGVHFINSNDRISPGLSDN